MFKILIIRVIQECKGEVKYFFYIQHKTAIN